MEIIEKQSQKLTAPVFLWIAGFILFLNIFFFFDVGRVRIALQFIGFFVFLIGIFRLQNTSQKLKLWMIYAFSLNLFFSLIPIFRAYTFVAHINYFANIALFLATIYLLTRQLNSFQTLSEFLLTPFNFLKDYFSGTITTIKRVIISKKFAKGDVFSAPHDNQKLGKIKKIVIGLIISFPILLILISLLTSGDPIYAHFIETLISKEQLKLFSDRAITSLLIYLLLLPLVYLPLRGRNRSAAQLFSKFTFVPEYTIVMALVAVVLGSFLIVQWPYVFANVAFETDLSKLGVATYSEYVRKGFSELLKVSLFVYSLIWLGLIALRNSSNSKHILKILQLVVIAQLLIFIISVLRRIWIYQTYHGWSLVRIYGGFLLIWLIGITLFLAARHFIKKSWVNIEVLTTAGFFILISFFNAEKFIVENHPPTVNKRIDYVYLSRMSTDGYEGLMEAYQQAINNTSTLVSMPVPPSQRTRQQFFYNALIIHNILKNYEELTLTHGTNAEIKEYYEQAIAYRIFEIDINLELLNRAENEAYPDQNFTTQKNQLLRYRDRLNEPITYEFLRQAFNVKDFRSYSDQYRWGNPMVSHYSEYFEYINFYGMQQKNKFIPNRNFNRLMNWNKSEVDVYKSIKTDMPLNKVFELAREQLKATRFGVSGLRDSFSPLETDISLDTSLIEQN